MRCCSQDPVAVPLRAMQLALLAAGIMVFAPCAWAQDAPAELPAIEAVPLPSERPVEEPEIEEPEVEEDTTTADPDSDPAPAPDLIEAPDPPLPDERPPPPRQDDAAEPETDADQEPSDEDDTVPAPPQPEDQAALDACRADLRALGAVFTEGTPLRATTAEEDGCGVARPFDVTEIVPGITLTPATQMRCETALALARWVEGEVKPAAEAIAATLPDLGRLAQISHGSTYVCRGRNNNPLARLSEHATGDAIDIMGFTFEDETGAAGRTIAVTPKEGDGDAEEAFQRAVRGGACLHFTTVLGPGSDAYHDDHLHFDLARRNGGFRLCE
jgi:hypothetical protein